MSLTDPYILSSGARDRPRADHAWVEQTIVDQTGRSFPLGASIIAEDVMADATGPPVSGAQYRVAPRSVATLFLRIGPSYGSSEPTASEL